MRQYRNGAFSILACIVGLTMAGTAHAQAPRSKVDMPTTPGVPEFRDPKTGQIWTPLNVGQQSGPPTPADLAFDPLGQAVYVRGVVVQRPSVVPLASVPITAGPTVPIVNIGDATLRAVAGKRWQVVLYLDNNSAGTVVPVINCRFTNAGNLVAGDERTAAQSRPRHSRRPDDLRPQGRPLRRPRYLRGDVALA